MKKSSLTLFKQTPLPEDLIQEFCHDPDPTNPHLRPLPPRRLRTHVPDPDIHHDLPTNLVLKLGECIGHGRSGIVFKVKPAGLPSDAPNATLPPLVAKFGRQHYSKWLLREAFFYEEMQSLQGVVVPWCYGFYSARIPVVPGQGFIPWLKGWRLRYFAHRRDEVGPEECLKSYQEEDGKDDEDEENLEDNEEKLIEFGKFRDQYVDLVQQFEDNIESGKRSTVVTVLILEQVGKTFLPIGGENWQLGKPIPKKMRYLEHYFDQREYSY